MAPSSGLFLASLSTSGLLGSDPGEGTQVFTPMDNFSSEKTQPSSHTLQRERCWSREGKRFARGRTAIA